MPFQFDFLLLGSSETYWELHDVLGADVLTCRRNLVGVFLDQHSDPSSLRAGWVLRLSERLGLKNWLDLNAQVQKHITRGLNLDDVSQREFSMFLYSSNYYRVSGYSRCFLDPTSTSGRYLEGTNAQTLIDVYDLDRRIRNAVLDGVSVVETTLRSRVAYHLTKIIGADDSYLDENLYLPVNDPDPANEKEVLQWEKETENRDHVLKDFRDLQDRKEIFIKHHIAKGQPVPFWAIVEVVSIGTFSRFLRALRDKSVLDPVVKSLKIEDEHKFLQAVQNIAFLRNIAAHHGRLWNRQFDGYVALPQIALDVKRDYVAPKTPAAALTLLAGMTDQIEKSDEYSTHLLGLVHSDQGLKDGYYRPIL